jgi:peptide deformylase
VIRKVVLYPDPLLKQRSVEVGEVTDEIRDLAKDLEDTMADQKGIGISAPQVGVLKRVIVVNCVCSSSHPPRPVAMVDPVVRHAGPPNEKLAEGCLSFPGVFEQVERATVVELEYTDIHGDRRQGIFTGIEARCVLHEIDHLDGRLFIERMSPVRREMVRKQLRRLVG